MNMPANENDVKTPRPLGVSIITFLLIISVASQVFMFYGLGSIDWVLWSYETALVVGVIGFYMAIQWCWLLVASLMLASIIISSIDAYTWGIISPELLFRLVIQLLILIYIFSDKVQQFFQFSKEKTWSRLMVVGVIMVIYFILYFLNLNS